jgi:hypothetical protein
MYKIINRLISIVITSLISFNGYSQIIDYPISELNKPIKIPKVENKVSIFIFEKRNRSYDPNNISLSERLSYCDIDFDKFIIYRFNLISGTCKRFDTIQYILNGDVWINKPQELNIFNHYVCISTPDKNTIEFISSKIGSSVLSSFDDSFPRNIRYPNSIVFRTFNGNNKNKLEDKLIQLVSRDRAMEIEPVISLFKDSIDYLRKYIELQKIKLNLGVDFQYNFILNNPNNTNQSSYFSYGVTLGLMKNLSLKKNKLISTIGLSKSKLKIELNQQNTTFFTGIQTDEFLDIYYGYVKVPNYLETIDYNFNSAKIGLKYLNGNKNILFYGINFIYNFEGHTSQSLNNTTAEKTGAYPILNNDLIEFGMIEVKNNGYKLTESFLSYSVGIGARVEVCKNVNLSLSGDYHLSDNLLNDYNNNLLLSEKNNTIEYYSILNTFPRYSLRAFSLNLQLNYEL